ncbi:DeoR/GlpR family DNA-binding transcription regulator [Stomatohabitans albus]|uniref:DeoR/GlpR family DNA-binding transcription regulator n=1 Tax=Stomatohabitans albus TaxID=3110766 RepID=UPI00300DBD45
MSEALRYDPSPSRRRQLQLLDLVVRRGAQHVDALAAELGVSSMTVYRDIAALETEQLVERHRGAVTAAMSSLSEFATALRMGRCQAEKEAMSARAKTMLRPGQAVLIDDSTTLFPLVNELHTLTPITVVTNSSLAMRHLGGMTGVTLISTGGEYVSWADGYVGTLSETTVRSLRLDVALMSVSAINQGWCMHSDPRFVSIKRTMMESATAKILVVDHTKFERSALYRIAPLSNYDHVITDTGISSDAQLQLEESGVPFDVVTPLVHASAP